MLEQNGIQLGQANVGSEHSNSRQQAPSTSDGNGKRSPEKEITPSDSETLASRTKTNSTINLIA